MAAGNTARSVLIRDQARALHAYRCIEQVPTADRKNYKIAVNDFGANVMRSGLCAALAAVQRLSGGRGTLLLQHIASASVPGLAGATGTDLPQRVRQMNADSYMVATREILQVAMWLKRATQAIFGDV